MSKKPNHHTILNLEIVISREFVAKIKQGDEDIKAGRTKKISLDDIWK